jgi:NhaA family Na+:H+ antiporter
MMAEAATTLSKTFQAFFRSERSAAVVLIACTVLAMTVANTAAGPAVHAFWETRVAGLSVVEWINDALMAVFFLLVGLELERELINGELADRRTALLPIVAALGGVLVPAGIHLALNAGTPTAAGAGIPMATDIAFALGVLALLGDRVPASLKIFLSALAVIDDLAAMLVIAIGYSGGVSFAWLGGALALCAALLALNKLGRIQSLWPYLLGGALMWFCMLRSGVHPTLAGVALAFTIPFSARADDERSPSYRLENALHLPVAFVVLPLFALANTGVVLGAHWREALVEANSLGILCGLVLGKPVGISLACALAVGLGICRLPAEMRWSQLLGAGMLGGIGFTMSIFIANLAFADNPALVGESKGAVLLASMISALAGLAWLRLTSKK